MTPVARAVDGRDDLEQSACMLTLETLPHQIQSGDVHTVVVAFPDLQGRPVGKRVTGSFFLDRVLHHGIEVCDYLLACDVDMNPLPGYEFASWETRLRRPPCRRRSAHASGRSPGCRAACWSSAISSPWRASPVEVSPAPDPPPPARAGRRARVRGQVRDRARVLPVPRLVRPGSREAVARAVTPHGAPSRTTSSSRPPARSTSSAGSATR